MSICSDSIANDFFCIAIDSNTCDRMIAANMTAHPISSLADRASPKMTQPATAANTDSKHMMSDATTGLACFCPRT